MSWSSHVSVLLPSEGLGHLAGGLAESLWGLQLPYTAFDEVTVWIQSFVYYKPLHLGGLSLSF